MELPPLGGRLMVRLQTLDLRIGVRVPASQPSHCATHLLEGREPRGNGSNYEYFALKILRVVHGSRDMEHLFH